MSFLKSLFGFGAAKPSTAGSVKQIDYKGFTIKAEPYFESGQYQTAGTIEKIVENTPKSHRFVRADRFGSAEEAADFALTKGRQIIDEQGERLFG